MAKSQKSAAARRREQLQKKKEQQNRMISMGAGVLAIVALAVIAYLVWQGLRPEPEATTTAGAASESDRPLADVDLFDRNHFYSRYPEFVIDLDKEYEAVIRTAKGDIRLELFDEEAPQTVNNFVFLANQGFYDGVTFHRVLENFMAQGGDPSGTGSGGPGYEFEDEVDNGLTFDRPGLLAMANAGPDTNGSQFFITFVPTPHLNGRHTIFGEVIEGMEVLDKLTRRDPSVPGQPDGDVMERIDIIEVEE